MKLNWLPLYHTITFIKTMKEMPILICWQILILRIP